MPQPLTRPGSRPGSRPLPRPLPAVTQDALVIADFSPRTWRRAPADSRPPGPYRRLFTVPGTRAFTAGNLIARLPMGMFSVSAVIMIAGSRGSYALAGAVTATGLAATAVVAPWTARLVDRHGQARIAVPATALAALGSLALLLCAHYGAPDWTLFAAYAATATTPNTGGMSRARWAHLLNGDEKALHTANSFEQAADELCFMLGPVLAAFLCGALFPEAGTLAGVVLLMTGVLLFAAQRSTEPPVRPRGCRHLPACLAPTRTPAAGRAATRPDDGNATTGPGAGAGTCPSRSGVRCVRPACRPEARVLDVPELSADAARERAGRRNEANTACPGTGAEGLHTRATSPLRAPGMRPLLAVCLATGAVFGSMEVATIAFADEQGHRAAAGAVLALQAAGSCAAGLLYGTLRPAGPAERRHLWCLAAMTALMTLPLLAAALTGSLLVLAGALLVAGTATAPTMITNMTLVQHRTPEGHLNEGMTLAVTGLLGGIAAGSAAGGWAAEQASATAAYGVPIAAAASALTLSLNASPSQRRQARHPSPPPSPTPPRRANSRAPH
ncbi:transporter [Streptomyces sp. NRRL WC-3618]|uniref:MFS transporter n=1 Tax=Streptomyces sp. NRRL WC-3618 TaxID=1519490 RepID=UPI0006AE61D5|nr:MFS transporter [Streptomyces sp. NRRL WC-3618]KOV82648.1 transporter [Streptomyces sp. NRRL WC-3618]